MPNVPLILRPDNCIDSRPKWNQHVPAMRPPFFVLQGVEKHRRCCACVVIRHKRLSVADIVGKSNKSKRGFKMRMDSDLPSKHSHHAYKGNCDVMSRFLPTLDARAVPPATSSSLSSIEETFRQITSASNSSYQASNREAFNQWTRENFRQRLGETTRESTVNRDPSSHMFPFRGTCSFLVDDMLQSPGNIRDSGFIQHSRNSNPPCFPSDLYSSSFNSSFILHPHWHFRDWIRPQVKRFNVEPTNSVNYGGFPPQHLPDHLNDHPVASTWAPVVCSHAVRTRLPSHPGKCACVVTLRERLVFLLIQ